MQNTDSPVSSISNNQIIIRLASTLLLVSWVHAWLAKGPKQQSSGQATKVVQVYNSYSWGVPLLSPLPVILLLQLTRLPCSLFLSLRNATEGAGAEQSG